jgi:hypothetical protein
MGTRGGGSTKEKRLEREDNHQPHYLYTAVVLNFLVTRIPLQVSVIRLHPRQNHLNSLRLRHDFREYLLFA